MCVLGDLHDVTKSETCENKYFSFSSSPRELQSQSPTVLEMRGQATILFKVLLI